jgi:predicted DNA repair protein MutK
MTVGVYGFVAGIVKLDDLGLYWSRAAGTVTRTAGNAVLWLAPWLMKTLSIVGTAAMFLVGGGILVHGVSSLHHAVEGLADSLGGITGWLAATLANAMVGLVAGAIVLATVLAVKRFIPGRAASADGGAH